MTPYLMTFPILEMSLKLIKDFIPLEYRIRDLWVHDKAASYSH